MQRAAKQTGATEMAELIRRLAALYASRPSEVQVNHQESEDGAAYFVLLPAPEDESRMVGAGGAHVKALELLVETVGQANGRPFTFRLIGEWYGAKAEPQKAAFAYDPEPARAVLKDWIEALGGRFTRVDVEPQAGAHRTFAYDFAVAVERNENIRLTIGALGTLFRAAGRQNGVKIQVNLK